MYAFCEEPPRVCGRRAGIMVSALDSIHTYALERAVRIRALAGDTVLCLLGKRLYQHSAPLHRGV